MTIVVLMAGGDTAFKEAGFAYPKNLTEVSGIPVLEHVVGALRSLVGHFEAKLVCIVRRDENLRHHTGSVIKLIDPGAKVVEARGETQGAACTAMLGVEWIVEDEPLIIVNGDIVHKVDLVSIVQGFQARDLDGAIIVFEGVHPRWSFVRLDEDGFAVEAAEKKPISNLATTGFYYFRRGEDFIDGVSEMLLKDAVVDGRFFVCPVYNELILKGKKIGVSKIDRHDYISFSDPMGIQGAGGHWSGAHLGPGLEGDVEWR